MLDSNSLWLYMAYYIIVIPFAFLGIINILSEIFKIRNEKNDRKIFLISVFLSISLSVILSSSINIVFKDNVTRIKEQSYSDLKWIVNIITDSTEKETEIIYVKTKDISMYDERKIKKGLKKPSNISYTTYYYMNIENGEFIIPVKNSETYTIIHNLLYKEYGEQKNHINAIEVYKNTKFIKAINGIDLDSNSEKIQNFINEKEYKIKINISNKGNFIFEPKGCTLDEFVTKRNARVCVLNEKGEEILDIRQIYKEEEYFSNILNKKVSINELGFHCYKDGKYYVCVKYDGQVYHIDDSTVFRKKETSNSIKFKVEKRKVLEFNVMEN